jgi:hypothetical protein
VDRDREIRLTRELLSPTSGEMDAPQEHPTPSKGTKKPIGLTNDFTLVSTPPTGDSTSDAAPWRRGAGNLNGSERGGMLYAKR